MHQKLQGVCAEIRVASSCGDLIAKVYSCAWKTATRDKAKAGDDAGKAWLGYRMTNIHRTFNDMCTMPSKPIQCLTLMILRYNMMPLLNLRWLWSMDLVKAHLFWSGWGSIGLMCDRPPFWQFGVDHKDPLMDPQIFRVLLSCGHGNRRKWRTGSVKEKGCRAKRTRDSNSRSQGPLPKWKGTS